MDIFMPRCTGVEAMITIKESLPKVQILMFTVSDHEEDLFRALRFGAAESYLLKSADIAELPAALRGVISGETILSSHIIRKLVDEFRKKSNGPALSSREADVLRLAGEGLANAEIARRLFVAESTIRTYMSQLWTSYT